jgi:L-arabinokinase
MSQRGVSLELTRTDFEAGRWQFHIEEAYEQGREAKELARKIGFQDEGAAEFIRIEIEKFLRGRKEVEKKEKEEELVGGGGVKLGCVGM